MRGIITRRGGDFNQRNLELYKLSVIGNIKWASGFSYISITIFQLYSLMIRFSRLFRS